MYEKYKALKRIDHINEVTTKTNRANAILYKV